MKILLMLLTLLFSVSAWADNVINILEPYARAVPPGMKMSAAFMVMENRSDKAVKLMDAKCNVANIVELHTHIQEEGMMKMRRIDSIELPPYRQVILQPGGLHIMLIDLQQQLLPGQEIELSLNFSDGSISELTLPVKAIKMMDMKHHHH